MALIRVKPTRADVAIADGIAAHTGRPVTRIVLLAHRASDVVVGLAVGVAVERLLRVATRFGRR